MLSFLWEALPGWRTAIDTITKLQSDQTWRHQWATFKHMTLSAKHSEKQSNKSSPSFFAGQKWSEKEKKHSAHLSMLVKTAQTHTRTHRRRSLTRVKTLLHSFSADKPAVPVLKSSRHVQWLNCLGREHWGKTDSKFTFRDKKIYKK